MNHPIFSSSMYRSVSLGSPGSSSVSPHAGLTTDERQLEADLIVALQSPHPKTVHGHNVKTGHHESPLAKFVISGGVTWGFEFVCGHGLEFAKIARQTSADSYPQIYRHMTGTKGIIGVLDGFFPWGTIQAISKGAVFGWAHALSRNYLNHAPGLPNEVKETVAGGMAGGIQGVVLSPILLLKTRVMTDPNFRTQQAGLWKTAVASSKVALLVVQKEGVRGVMKGSFWFSLKRVADWATRFMFVEVCENLYRRARDFPYQSKLSFQEQMWCGLAGGTISAVSTIPLDVVVANFQKASKAGQKTSFAGVFAEQAGGQKGIMPLIRASSRGFLARALHVAITTAALKVVCTELVEKWAAFTEERQTKAVATSRRH